jgi:DNA-binding NarL/FixJ family response regulator
MTSIAHARHRIHRLSGREVCVLMRIRDGWKNRQIADDLGISESTVKTHVSTLLRKLDVQSRTEAAVMAQRLLFSRAV